jgi:NAD(P)-dependent dehydrogenase (short-subunit alcohol dehydrogenase family)
MSTVDLSSSTALITGANRGFGRRFAEQLVRRGATVWAAARNPDAVDLPGVRPLRLDITDPASVAAAAGIAGDVTLLVNNAGIATGTSVLTGDIADLHREFDTHVFGTLDVTKAFVPVLERNGGGTILNVLSVLSWVAFPGAGAYCAAKSAEWSITNALRAELAPRGISVAALHVGYMDTDLTSRLDVPKSDPAVIAAYTLDQLAAGAPEIVADDVSRQVQAGLAHGVPALYPQLAQLSR